MAYARYAIYYTPPPGPLAEFGAAWLGWDPRRGAAVPHPPTMGLPLPVARLSEQPRKYGFHGTLKPPFRLADGTREEDLRGALAEFAADHSPVWLDALKLARIGKFLALVPEGEQAGLADLAARIVTEFDGFRAPPGEAELARRRQASLSPAQEALLERWGYPYVMDEFRFHLTLTGPLPPEDADSVRLALDPITAPLLPVPFIVDELTLLGEAEDGCFHEIERFALTG
ncbi:DUF1045 domain-containing protein [Pseudoruegeria sp. SHC-113]|uniref:DUF1045 domain-containing protein n=1 Tax=Pseudoruegeria sp. SHC-113 TaxID=2855439 RepID=UPI0021BB1666|nr:DUF1045 domain-containing protein [Pseudoruegeria sp. SHC-113]MCT8162015.1 DUF1045 domain-containing protein [Pseudoruegeria sp. SHC-113]